MTDDSGGDSFTIKKRNMGFFFWLLPHLQDMFLWQGCLTQKLNQSIAQ
jgi:hypothetical protein